MAQFANATVLNLALLDHLSDLGILEIIHLF